MIWKPRGHATAIPGKNAAQPVGTVERLTQDKRYSVFWNSAATDKLFKNAVSSSFSAIPHSIAPATNGERVHSLVPYSDSDQERPDQRMVSSRRSRRVCLAATSIVVVAPSTCTAFRVGRSAVGQVRVGGTGASRCGTRVSSTVDFERRGGVVETAWSNAEVREQVKPKEREREPSPVLQAYATTRFAQDACHG